MALRTRSFWILAVALVAARAGAADIEDPCRVPASLQDTAGLSATYARLSRQAGVLDAQAGPFNARCGVSHDPNSDAGRACVHDFKILSDAIAAHNQQVDAFNGRLAAATSAKLAQVNARLAATRAKIDAEVHRSADFEKAANDWLALAQRERERVILHMTFGLAEQVADAGEASATADIELTTVELSRAHAWYRSYAQTLPAAQAQQIAARLSHLHTQKDLARLLGWLALTGSRSTGLTESLTDRRASEALKQATLGLLKEMATFAEIDPTVRAAITSLEMAIDGGYYFATYLAARGNINLLDSAQGLSVRAIDSLGRLYARDIDRRRQLEASTKAMQAGDCAD